MKQPDINGTHCCSICAASNVQLFDCDGGQVCDGCAETTRQGRDNTSRALKAKHKIDTLHVELLSNDSDSCATPETCEYTLASGALMAQVLEEVVPDAKLGSGGEIIRQKSAGLVNTLTEPKIAALEASNHRTELLTMLGTDIAAMALDAAATVEAANSLEMMLAHQMAAIHQLSMKMAHRASLIQDPAVAVKTMNAAMKGFSTYQGGLAALRHLRGTQQQHIVVQHVNVASGGQAMVGNVNTEGRA